MNDIDKTAQHRQLEKALARYREATGTWSAKCEEAEETGDPVDVTSCERYSEEMENIAHELARVTQALLEHPGWL